MDTMKNYNIKWQKADKPYSASFVLDTSKPTQYSIGATIAACGFYEPATTDIFINNIQAGDFVIDIGSHIGYFAILAAHITGDMGKVVAIEADIDNYGYLCKQIELNKLENNILALNAAAWSEDKTMSLWTNLDNDGGHALWDTSKHYFNKQTLEQKPGSREIDALCLKTIFSKAGDKKPKILKIDTEGAEYDILSGLKDVSEKLHPELIIAEINTLGLREMGHSEKELRLMMSSLKYECFILMDNSDKPIHIPASAEIELTTTIDGEIKEAVANAVFVPGDKAENIFRSC